MERVVSVSYAKNQMHVLDGAAPKIQHSYEEVKQRSHKQKGQKGFIFEPKKFNTKNGVTAKLCRDQLQAFKTS